MTTRNDIFKNVKIRETFYIEGHEAVKVDEESAELYDTYDGWIDVTVEPNAQVTIG